MRLVDHAAGISARQISGEIILTLFIHRCKFNIMVRTQIQLPDDLYREAKRIAAEQEISLAEVLRRGLEHMQRIYPPRPNDRPWQPPKPINLGPFQAPEAQWRELANR